MVLVTGGAGYIGSHVNKELNKKGYKTVVFDNLLNGHEYLVKWGDFFLGDLSNERQIRAVFKKYPIDAVMHFAALAYVGESLRYPMKYYLNNVSCTLNLLNVMIENGIKYFIFSSSCATYGIAEKLPLTELSKQDPINPYGRSKLIVEEILSDVSCSNDLFYASLRYFNAAGADPECEIGEQHDPETHLIPIALEAAMGHRSSV